MEEMELIKKVYARWKISRGREPSEHPDEETFICFFQGFLNARDEAYLKEHILDCPRCAEIIAAGAAAEDTVPIPLLEESFIRQLKGLCSACGELPSEAEFSWKEGIFRLLRVSGEFTLRGYAVEGAARAGADRGRGIRKAVLYRKLKKTGLEITVSGQDIRRFSLQVRSGRVAGGELRAALFCRGKESESKSFVEGRAAFSGIAAGDYLLEVSTVDGERLAAARLVLRTD
jgi:hypothetical protein